MLTVLLDMDTLFVDDIGAGELRNYFPDYTNLIHQLISRANKIINEQGIATAANEAMNVAEEMSAISGVKPSFLSWLSSTYTWVYIRYINWLRDYTNERRHPIGYLSTMKNSRNRYITLTIH